MGTKAKPPYVPIPQQCSRCQQILRQNPFVASFTGGRCLGGSAEHSFRTVWLPPVCEEVTHIGDGRL